MILNRLRVNQKLNLLVAVPMVVIFVFAVPVAAQQVHNSGAADATATRISYVAKVGTLAEDLDTERALDETYLASDTANTASLAVQYSTVDQDVAAVRQDVMLPTIAPALADIGSLSTLRQAVLDRTADPLAVDEGYSTAIVTLINELSLTTVADPSSAATGDLSSLYALLLSDEYSGEIGAALLVAEDRPAESMQAMTQASDDASLQADQEQRFKSVASAGDAALFDRLQNSRAAAAITADLTGASRVVTTAGGVPTADGQRAAADYASSSSMNAMQADEANVLADVQSLDGMRGLVQDNIVHEVTDTTVTEADSERTVAAAVIALALLTMISAMVLAIRIGRSISVPLRGLTLASDQIAAIAQQELIRVIDEDRPDHSTVPRLAAVEVAGDDEISELATAVNRVQGTAAMLLERQVASRTNISAMFSSVGRRTQNLVSRQLALVDALEREEQDPAVLEKLFRLDHLTSRLRRTSNSLMVISGITDRVTAARPTALSVVLRSATAQIEEYRRVRLGQIDDVMFSPAAVGDLTLLFAELLENALAFSPPSTIAEVVASGTPCGHTVRIVDHGHGMSETALLRENARLVRRERLDLAPTDVLGLFVVGRISRRHGLTTTLEHTPGGGVTVVVVIPESLLFTRAELPAPGQPPAEPAADQPIRRFAEDQAAASTTTRPPARRPSSPEAAAPVGGLARRVRGATLTANPSPAVPAATAVSAGAAGTTSQLPATAAGEGYGFDWLSPPTSRRPAGPPNTPPPTGSTGLQRRVPGTSLECTADGPRRPADADATAEALDPDLARARIEAFELGIARAMRDFESGTAISTGDESWNPAPTSTN